jgi:RNA polymerase sigma factor (sigma-70 family)
MPTSPTAHAVRYLRGIASDAGQADADLLGRFIDRRDEGAFALLVRRHGAMVYGVCRRLLPTDQDAEDAFQATFLVLVEKARTVVPREAVGNWLFGVARRAALLARRTIARRKEQVGEVSECLAAEPEPLEELRAALDEELNRLPDTYRTVIVLCDLEERTRREVAGQLGWPEGTVAGRLARAREMLAKRLARRGVVLSAGPLAAVLAQHVASAGVPPSVVSNTIGAAGFLVAGPGARIVSSRVSALTEGVLKAMLVSKLKASVAVALVLGLVATGAMGLGYHTAAAPGDKPPAAEERLDAPQKDKHDPTALDEEVAKLQGEWKFVAFEAGGAKASAAELKGKKLVIKGNEITGLQPGPTDRLSFKLDPKKTPKEIDITVVEGNLKGTTASGIYAIEGQKLRICLAEKVRPKEFATTPGSGREVHTLEKEVPIAWGKEVDGLQVGIGIGFGPGAPRVYQVGESVQLTVKLRNNSDAPIRYTSPTAPARSRVPTVRDAAGRAVSVKQSWPPDSQLKEDTLKPREEVVLDHAGFDLEPLGRAGDPNNHILRVKPGTYTVSYSELLESHRSLATGFAEFEVGEPAKPVPTPKTPAPLAPGKTGPRQPGGVLGDRLGEYLTIEGVLAEGVKIETGTFVVDTVNGKKLDKPVPIVIRPHDFNATRFDLPTAYVIRPNCRTVLKGFESGEMIGVPEGVRAAAKELGRSDVPMSPKDWQWRPYFVVYIMFEPKSEAPGR